MKSGRIRASAAALAAAAMLAAAWLLGVGRDGAGTPPIPTAEVARADAPAAGALEEAVLPETAELRVPAAPPALPAAAGPSPAGSLVVRVVDASCAPAAGVPVDLRGRRPEPPPEEHDDRTVATLITDDDGRARFELEDLRAAARPPATPVVALAIPLAVPVERVLDRGAPPREPVELVLPPVGGLTVVLEEADGAPYDGEALVQVWPRFRHGESLPRSPAIDARLDAGAGGRARFDRVGLDLVLGIGAYLRGRPHPSALVLGPRRAGERVEATLRFDPAPLLTARIVDGAGGPLARRTVEARIWPCTRYASREVSDREGRVVLLVRELTEPRRCELEVWASQDDELVVACAPLAGPLADGSHDLGDVVLAPLPVLAEGVVVGPHGAPVEGARVRVVDLVPTGGERRRGTDAAAVTGSAGRFRVGGSLRIEELRLEASLSGRPLRATRTVAAGSAGVVLELPDLRTGELLVRFEPPAAADLVRLTSASDANVDLRVVRRDEDGELVLGWLPPEPFDLAVRTYDPGDPVLVTVSGIDVRAGETTRDPRLQPLDLRPHLREIVVRAVDPEGAALDVRAAVLHRPLVREDGEDDPPGWEDGEHRFDGTARIAHLGGAREVLVRAEGRLEARLVAVAGEHEVALPPSPNVRVRVISAPGDLPLGYVLLACARPVGSEFDEGEVAAEVRDGQSVLRPGTTGPHEVQLRLMRLGPWGKSWQGGLARGPVVVDVRAGAPEQEVELEVDARRLEQALARMR